MKKGVRWQKILILAVVAALFFQLSACGYILYPERRGQPAGEIDVKIAVLDALGLLFFIIPGVVAFAVDFTNHTIYLPPGKRADGEAAGNELIAITFPDEQLTPRSIEEALSAYYGRKIDLSSEKVQVYEMKNLDDVRASLLLQ